MRWDKCLQYFGTWLKIINANMVLNYRSKYARSFWFGNKHERININKHK